MSKTYLIFYFFLSLAVMLILTQTSFAISYYNVIEEELNYCENKGGDIVGIENGKITKDTGCPGCFCQFKDDSICKMEHLMKVCKKGEYKTYLQAEEINKLPDLIIESGTRGYVTSNPGLRRFYFVNHQSKEGKELHHASGVELPGYFKTKWADLEEAKYLFFKLSIANSNDVDFEGKFSLYFNGMRLKTWNTNDLNTEGYILGDIIYIFLDINEEAGKHEFVVVAEKDEMSKKNNIYSFYIDREKFEYITHQDNSDYARDYYETFDGKKVDAIQLELDYSDNPTNNYTNDSEEPEKTLWQKISSSVISFFKELFNK